MCAIATAIATAQKCQQHSKDGDRQWRVLSTHPGCCVYHMLWWHPLLGTLPAKVPASISSSWHHITSCWHFWVLGSQVLGFSLKKCRCAHLPTNETSRSARFAASVQCGLAAAGGDQAAHRLRVPHRGGAHPAGARACVGPPTPPRRHLQHMGRGGGRPRGGGILG